MLTFCSQVCYFLFLDYYFIYIVSCYPLFFFFKQKTAYEMRISDWSSDVCSSDLAEVRDVFRSSKFGAVAGCMVVEGVARRNKPIRVLRDNTVIFEGELESLRRFKENVDEVRSGTECGIGVKQYNDVQPGDQIECFERIEVQRTL